MFQNDSNPQYATNIYTETFKIWRGIEPDMLAEPFIGNECFQAETELNLYQREILFRNNCL